MVNQSTRIAATWLILKIYIITEEQLLIDWLLNIYQLCKNITLSLKEARSSITCIYMSKEVCPNPEDPWDLTHTKINEWNWDFIPQQIECFVLVFFFWLKSSASICHTLNNIMLCMWPFSHLLLVQDLLVIHSQLSNDGSGSTEHSVLTVISGGGASTVGLLSLLVVCDSHTFKSVVTAAKLVSLN